MFLSLHFIFFIYMYHDSSSKNCCCQTVDRPTGRCRHRTGPCQLDRTFCAPQGVVSGSCWHKNFFASYGVSGRYIQPKMFLSLSLSIFVTLFFLVCFHDKVVIAKKFRVAFTETPPNSIRSNFNSIFLL